VADAGLATNAATPTRAATPMRAQASGAYLCPRPLACRARHAGCVLDLLASRRPWSDSKTTIRDLLALRWWDAPAPAGAGVTRARSDEMSGGTTLRALDVLGVPTCPGWDAPACAGARAADAPRAEMLRRSRALRAVCVLESVDRLLCDRITWPPAWWWLSLLSSAARTSCERPFRTRGASSPCGPSYRP